jgi:hypothetical protein
MTEFKSKMVKIGFPIFIKAPVDKVFPLCSPVEEYKWIPGWKCNLIHCPNDRVEQGTIFSEISSAPFLMGSFQGKTTWTVVKHDSESYKIHFRLDNKNSSSLYKIELEDNGKGGTEGKLNFTYNGINKKGNKLVGKNLEGKIHIMLSILKAMLQHYCETDEMLSPSELQKMIQSEQSLSVIDKIPMGLNRLAISNMIDKDRGRFMKKIYGTGK